jgi:hypothetical protein
LALPSTFFSGDVGQIEGLHIEGEDQRPTQAIHTTTPLAAKVQKPAPSGLAMHGYGRREKPSR